MFNHHDNDYGAEGGEESGYNETFDGYYSLKSSLKGVLTAGLILATGATGCGEGHPEIGSMSYDEAQQHIEQVEPSEEVLEGWKKAWGEEKGEKIARSSIEWKSESEEVDLYYFDRTYRNLGGPEGQVVYQSEDGWKKVEGVQDLWKVGRLGGDSINAVVAVIDEETALEIERVEAEDGYFTEEWVDPDNYERGQDVADFPRRNAHDGLKKGGLE